MTVRFGTDPDALLNAEAWAITTTGLVYLIEVYDEEKATHTVPGGLTDTYGVLYGVPALAREEFDRAHGGTHLELAAYRDGADVRVWARQMVGRLRQG